MASIWGGDDPSVAWGEKFKAFTSILVGMTLIGLSIGFLIGYYIPNIVPENQKIYWIYIPKLLFTG